MTMTIFLRFDNEDVAIAILAAYRTESGEWMTAGTGFALDVIGQISLGGEWDTSGTEPVLVTPPTVLPGYHVNFVGELPADLARFQVFPAMPYRVFAA